MSRTEFKKMVPKMADFTVFSDRALIKELKKCSVELEHV